MRYANSRLRLVLLVCLIVASILILASPSGAQTAAPPVTNAPPKHSVFSLMMQHTDPVFYVIMALSISGMTLIIQGFMQNRASAFMPIRSTETIRDLIRNRRFQDLMDFTERDPSFISRAINPALKRAPSFAAMKEAMETAVGEQTAEQFRKIEYLNIIGNLGPLLGLLGTVLGMIDAFQSLHDAGGQANPADLSYGIAEALVHTMLGLMLAIPCLAAFGILRTMVDRLTIRGALVAEELLLMIKPADARPAAAAASAGSIVPQQGQMTPARPSPVPQGPALPQPGTFR